MMYFLKQIEEKCQDQAWVFGYGHIGDGNLHLNVSVKKEDEFEKI